MQSTVQKELPVNPYLLGSKKRALDLTLATSLLFPGASTILTAAFFNKLIDPSEPAFYKATRVGQNGSTIPVWKIRTLKTTSAPETEIDHVSPDRINFFGKTMRRTSIDELPQLLSVFKGDMSFVGPRVIPERIFDRLRQSIPPELFNHWYQCYISQKPALVGLAQISGHRDLPDTQRAILDINYYQTASLMTDLKIIAETPIALLKGRGIR